MKALRVVSILFLLAASGCGVFFTFDFGGLRETGSSELKRFTSERELTDYLRAQIRRHNGRVTSVDRIFEAEVALGDAPADSAGPEAPPTPGMDGSAGSGADADDESAGNFSGTTIQEAGVDEADVVKTDGTYLYMIVSGGTGSILRIVRAYPPEDAAVVSETQIEGYGQDIYLYDDKVVALTSVGGFVYFPTPVGIEPVPVTDVEVVDSDSGGSGSSGAGDGVTVDGDEPADDPDAREPDDIAPPQFERPKTVVTVVDVSDRSVPAVLSSTKFDGIQASSRLIDGVLHLVVSNYQNYYVDVLPMLGSTQLDAGQVDAADLMPAFVRADDAGETSGDVVTWRELYHPTDPDGFGMVYVVSVDIDNDADFTAVGVVAEPGMIYSSREALYLTDGRYDFSGATRQTTDIYKFAYQDRGAQPTATGTVPGRVLNQYSMGENDGFLRVATTVDRTFGVFGIATESSNNVYVLAPVDGSLSVVGSLENVAPGETIRAARFVGKRGYVVTFEQIDPLFTLDLTDPTNPRVIGVLEVPGFSTYIVPIDDNHLLTVGQYIPPPPQFGPWGVQLSIYDITDFAKPKVQDNVIIGADTGASSEAIWNPKAFTYFAQAGLVALPVDIFGGPIFFEDPRFDTDLDDSGTSTGGAGQDAPPPPGADGEAPSDGTVTADEPVENGEPVEPPGFNGVFIYSATASGGLEELGRISTRFGDRGIYGSTFTRGIFIENASGEEMTVYAVTNFGLRAVPRSAMTAEPIELVFDQ